MVRATVEEVAFGGRQRLILKNPFSPKLFPPHPLLPPFFFFFFSFFFFGGTIVQYNSLSLSILRSWSWGVLFVTTNSDKKFSFDLARALSSLFFLLLHIFFAGEVISFFFSFFLFFSPFFPGLPFSYSLP